MAKITEGPIRITGTIGNLVISKTKHGYVVREKSSRVNKKRIETDKAFTRTKENNQTFSTAVKANKLIRYALRPVAGLAKDGSVLPRLQKPVYMALKGDKVNKRGEQLMQHGNLALLEGFEFNAEATLKRMAYLPYKVKLNRDTGVSTIEIASFRPSEAIDAGTATHYQISAISAAIDFEGERYEHAVATGGVLRIDGEMTEAIQLCMQLTPGSMQPMFIALAVELFQEVNGERYPVRNGKRNACKIVAVDTLTVTTNEDMVQGNEPLPVH